MYKKFKLSYILIILVIAILGITGCGSRTEAVINDGNDITQAEVEYPTLEESKAAKFNYSDLVVNNIRYLMTENEVKNIMGSPTETRELQNEKMYSYNEMSVVFEKIDGTYKVTQVASISDSDIFSRKLKVGDSVDDILNAYYRDSNYQNNYYKSEDGTAIFGKYLYGQFTVNELNKVNTKEEIAYGILDYNGYSNVESAQSYYLKFTYFDAQYKSGRATVNDDFAELIFEIDNKGEITAISWYYYPEENV